MESIKILDVNTSKKRKIFDVIFDTLKKMKFIRKRKISFNTPTCKKYKKYKNWNCYLHEERYICDIYECNGSLNRDLF